MGNKCACFSCCQTRPRYKQHVRAAVFNYEIESLGKFAQRTPTQLADIGRYIKKQIVNNLQNDSRVRFAMESYSCIINLFVDDNKNRVLQLMDGDVVQCCDLLLLEGFKHNNVDYIMYAMQTLKSLLKSVQDRFFAFPRLSNIFDLLVKIGRSEHMETESYYGNGNGMRSSSNSQIQLNRSEIVNHSASFHNKYTQNINGFTEKTIIYHALDTLRLSVEIRKNQIVEDKFSDLMSLFIYNLRPTDIAKSMLNTTMHTDIDGNKTSTDIEQIAMKGFELLCTNIAAFNTDKLHFTLEQIEQDIRRYDVAFVLKLLQTISKKSRVNAIDIAKCIVDTVKYKAISTSAELYKMEPTIKMMEILIKYSSFCEKSNRYQIISSLCDCIKWLDDIPDFYQPTVPIYHCQQQREKLYAGDHIDTHNFAQIQSLKRSRQDTKEQDDDDDKKNDQKPLPVPASFRVSGNIENDKLSVLFKFANKCLQCISVYVSYYDIQSTLSRAILPRLNKARSFWHKKYLLHASMETALRQKRSQRSPLTTNMLRYILQCPFLNADTMNELHRNELIDLSQLLFQNLALIPSLKRNNNHNFLQNVLEFEHLMSKRLFISADEKPNLSTIDRQSKKWIYCVIYKCITDSTIPIYILKSFSRTINIIFESAHTDDVLCDDLKVIFQFLISLQAYALSLNETSSEISSGVLIHTWILSQLFVLSRCFNQSSPCVQELISRLKDVQHRRQESHQVWSHFLIDEFGLIQTTQTMKDELTLQISKSIQDESVRIPPIFGGGDESNDIDDVDIDLEDIDENHKIIPRQKSESLPNKGSNDLINDIDIVTHVIAFDKLLPIIAKCLNIETEQEREQWITEASSRYFVDPDYRDLFKAPTVLSGPQLYNEASTVALSESGELTMYLVDAASIPSEIYFGFDVFDPPTTVNKQSVRNLFDDDFDSGKRLKWRKNLLIKKKIATMEYFHDVIDVYCAQMSHIEKANDIYFNNLEDVMYAEFNCNIRNESNYYINITGIDEDEEHDRDASKDDAFLMNFASMSLLRYQYLPETIDSKVKLNSNNSNDNDASMYLLIDQELVSNGDIEHNESIKQCMNDLKTKQKSNNNNNNTILTREFEYRLGLKQFDFEGAYRGVEYELSNLNLNDIDDAVIGNILPHHYHQYMHNDNYYESDISSDSDDDFFLPRNPRNPRRHRGVSKAKKKKKKKRMRKMKKGQITKNFVALSKKLRDGLEDMRQKQRGDKARHNQTESNNEIEMHQIRAHLDIKRQQSLPQNNQYDDAYYRQQMFAKDAGSLTDGDEPFEYQSARSHHLNHLDVKNKGSNRNQVNIAVPSTSNTPQTMPITTKTKQNRNKRHHRRQSSSISISHSSFGENHDHIINTMINTNNIIEEEEPQYYYSNSD